MSRYALAVLFAVSALFGAGGAQVASAQEIIRAEIPAIHDWSTLRIALTRTGCLGACPEYRVTISGNGTVDFEGQAFVASPGHHHAQISPGQVRELMAAFARAGFFTLQDFYFGPVMDRPGCILSVAFDGRTKSVMDVAGGLVSMPERVRRLESEIDLIAGTAQWVQPR
ncbi:MAG TPA: DUF6438 domain-containing protein [Bryobacteraceae bacterium]|jgi:hypothetical protein|nr:DUF6438 domain-containing protein [Bryobacteraceae bacterium]